MSATGIMLVVILAIMGLVSVLALVFMGWLVIDTLRSKKHGSR